MANTFKALEEIGAVVRDACFGVRDVGWHREPDECFVDDGRVDHISIRARDNRLDVLLDVGVGEVCDLGRVRGYVVEFSHEEQAFEQRSVDARRVRKLLERRDLRLFGRDFDLISLARVEKSGYLHRVHTTQDRRGDGHEDGH